MHLSCVKISNILSFPFIEHLNSVGGVVLDSSPEGSINILIGPNGSGKSNFLEIVNQVIKVGLFKDFVLSTLPLQKNIPEDFPLVLQEKKQTLRYLQRHFASEDKKSLVYLKLALCKQDYENIRFVFEHQEMFLDLIKKYSHIPLSFPSLAGVDELLHTESLEFYFAIDYQTKTIVLKEKIISPALSFWYCYVQYFELFQLSLVLHNHYLMLPPLPSLHSSFATLGSSREFTDNALNKHVDRFSGFDLDTIVYSQDTKRHGQPPIGYYLCKKKLLERYKDESFAIQSRYMQASDIDEKLLKTEKVTDYHTHFFEMLCYYIHAYVGLTLVPYVKDDTIILYFLDNRGNRLVIGDLSSGGQSFLYIIFTLFGYGLGNGVMIIDEPEMHLHPQMQTLMLEMLKDFVGQYQLQIVMATHSPLMINEHTIKNVYRLTWRGNGTHIHANRHQFALDESQLVQMLKFGYTAKIFFVNSIIMVEGETDEYFFDHYLRYLKTQDHRHEKIKDFAVINVNGKGGHRRWKRFLLKFGIRAHFLGDWDNIIDTGLSLDFHQLHCENRGGGNRHRQKFSKHYASLVRYIRDHKPHLFAQINKHIYQQYRENVYILQQGDLEAYLGLSIKGLDNTVRFCHEGFDRWIHNKTFDSHRQELELIFERIFGVGRHD